MVFEIRKYSRVKIRVIAGQQKVLSSINLANQYLQSNIIITMSALRRSPRRRKAPPRYEDAPPDAPDVPPVVEDPQVEETPQVEEQQQEAQPQEEESAQLADREEEDDDAPEEGPASSKSSKGDRSVSREQRKKRRDELRSKSVGVVVGKIDTSKTASNKILFGDKYDAEQASQKVVAALQEEKEEDSDDDQVEEVKASVAKEQALEQRQKERKTATELHKLEATIKRKRKPVEEDAPMDDDFFAQLDVELDEERKEKKRKVAAAPKGKHTTFVSTNENDDVVEADHNIEVVVLADAATTVAASSFVGGSKPSEAAMIFSRGRMEDGISAIKKSGGATKTKPQKSQGWKRSNKMNRILLTKKRTNKPASHFVIKA